MVHTIIVLNPLAAAANGDWENTFLFEYRRRKRSARSSSSRSPRSYARPPARSSSRGMDGRGSRECSAGSRSSRSPRACTGPATPPSSRGDRSIGTVATAHDSWPVLDQRTADAMDNISDDDVSESTGSEEEGIGEAQRSRQGGERPEAYGTLTDARSSARGDRKARGKVEGSVSENVWGIPDESDDEDQKIKGYVHDDEGSIGDGDTASDDKDPIEPKNNGVQGGMSTRSLSRLALVGDADDEVNESQHAAPGSKKSPSKAFRRRQTNSHRKEGIAKTVATSKKRPTIPTAPLGSNRGTARSTRGGRESDAMLLLGDVTPVSSPLPSLMETPVTHSDSFNLSGEKMNGSSEGETAGDDDSDDYEPDILPPDCSGLHKNRKTYKSALCKECYTIYVG